MTAHTTPSTRLVLSVSPRSAAVAGVGAVLLMISLLGPGWLFSPANEAAHIPATTLNFADLHQLSSSGAVPTNWIQHNYFAWLGWVLIVATIVATSAAVLGGGRLFGALGVVLSVLGLLLGLFAAKGVLTWSRFYHLVPDLRVGAYLLVVGYLLTLVSAAASGRR
jgi:hypothetical protein